MRRELNGILIAVGLMWLVFFIDVLLPIQLTQYGMVPRTTSGLIGIVTMPFLHAGFGHILNNTVPLVVLLVLLFGSHPHPIRVTVCLIGLTGVLLWLFGVSRTDVHIGASGLIYALIAFLIVAGLRQRRPIPIAISLLVGLLYGGTLIWGVLPFRDEHISWDGHLLGAVAGGLLAWGTTRRKR